MSADVERVRQIERCQQRFDDLMLAAAVSVVLKKPKPNSKRAIQIVRQNMSPSDTRLAVKFILSSARRPRSRTLPSAGAAR